jgi:hypothetical protein
MFFFFIVQKVLFFIFINFLGKYGCGCNPAGILMMTGDNIWEGIFTWWDDPRDLIPSPYVGYNMLIASISKCHSFFWRRTEEE